MTRWHLRGRPQYFSLHRLLSRWLTSVSRRLSRPCLFPPSLCPPRKRGRMADPFAFLLGVDLLCALSVYFCCLLCDVSLLSPCGGRCARDLRQSVGVLTRKASRGEEERVVCIPFFLFPLREVSGGMTQSQESWLSTKKRT